MKALRRLVRETFDSIPLIRRRAFRLSLLDLVWPTFRWRRPESAFNVYVDWREGQQRRYGFDFYPSEGLFRDTCRFYYGKVDRVSLALQLLEHTLARRIEGHIAEFGVFWGFTAYALNHVLIQHKSDKHLYLFDSFKGFPTITHDLDRMWKKGDFATSEEKVRRLFTDVERVRIVPGFFSDTLPHFENLRFSFCHVDCDLYPSVMESLEYVYPRLSPGGVVVVDDYNFRTCPAVKEAVGEFLGKRDEPHLWLPTGQGVFIARCPGAK